MKICTNRYMRTFNIDRFLTIVSIIVTTAETIATIVSIVIDII